MRFQCLVPSGTGLQVLASSMGILTIVNKTVHSPNNIINHPRIFLNHQDFSFNATHKKIAWRFVNNETCTAPVSFKIQSFTCNHIVKTWYISSHQHNLVLTLSDIQFNKIDLYLNITTIDANQKTCTNTVCFQLYPDSKLQ